MPKKPKTPVMLPPGLDGQRVLSFKQWCALNDISIATGRRLIDAGKAPEVVRLSPRRIGVTVAANAAWQEACKSAKK
jgi:predicted DNA-binding transcriptional regulator AlpA